MTLAAWMSHRRKLATRAEALSAEEPALPGPSVQFYTFREFMDDSLYHRAWGYYSNGRIRFGHSASEDFTTFPVALRPVFGAMIAERAAGFWLASGCPGLSAGDAPFVLLELGAGLGVLAHDVLAHLRDCRPEMYASVVYVIGERSPSLRAEQSKTNARFIGEKRLEVRAVDAQSLRDGALRNALQRLVAARRDPLGGGGGSVAAAPPLLRGVLLSNELPDAFAVEKVRLWRKAAAAAPREGASGQPPRALRMQRGLVLPLVQEEQLKRILVALHAAALAKPAARPAGSRSPSARRVSFLAGCSEPPPVGLELDELRQGSAQARAHARRLSWSGGDGTRPGGAAALSAWLTEREGWLWLSRHAYCELKARCCAAAERAGLAAEDLELRLDGAVHLAEVFGAAHGVPELAAWLDSRTQAVHAALVRAESRGEAAAPSSERRDARVVLEVAVNPAVSHFGSGAAKLFDSGAVLTIDYGAEAATLLNSATVLRGGSAGLLGTTSAGSSAPLHGKPLRRYPGGSGLRAYSRLTKAEGAAFGSGMEAVLSRPGWCDITSDVDFSQLAAAGEAAGLRTLYYGPQAGLETALRPLGGTRIERGGKATVAFGHRTTAFGADVSRARADAFYSMGTFMLLVQATPDLAAGWEPPALSLPLHSAGLDTGAQAALAMLRSLGRLMLEIALQLGEEPIDKLSLVTALADSDLTTVPCFQPHWRALLPIVLDAVNRGRGVGAVGAGGGGQGAGPRVGGDGAVGGASAGAAASEAPRAKAGLPTARQRATLQHRLWLEIAEAVRVELPLLRASLAPSKGASR